MADITGRPLCKDANSPFLPPPSEQNDASSSLTYREARIDNRRFVALFLIICVLFVLRRPDSLTNPQFWAEDGLLLFQGQLLHSSLGWIFVPYKGYLIVNTKLIAAIAALFPIVYAPLLYNVSAILIASLACSLFARTSYRHLIRSDWLRVCACLGATGALYTESLVDNVCNSQWYLALIGFLLLFRLSSGNEPRWKALLFPVVACIAALTNPVMVIAIPICLWQLARKRNRWLALLMLVGIVTQIAFFLFYPSVPTTSPPRPHLGTLLVATVIAAVYKVVISTFFGWRTVLTVANAGSSLIFFVTLLLSVAWLAWLFLRLDAARRMQLLTAIYLISVSIALPMSGRGLFQAFRKPTHILEPRGEQYFFIAGCALLFLIALSIERTISSRWKYVQSATFLLVIGVGFWQNFEVPRFQDFQWPEEAKAIDAWSVSRNALFAAGVVIPINPPSLFIELPARFHDMTIGGFPDHLWARSLEGEDHPISIAPSFLHDSKKLEYIDLPLVLGTDSQYRLSASVRSEGTAVVSILVHGRLDHGTWVETAPMSVSDGAQVRMDVRTDSDGRLCIHLKRLSGVYASIRSLSLYYLAH